MTSYDERYFDRAIDRSGTEATKWDRFGASTCDPTRPLPLWLADMDLATSEEITDALTARAAHPIYGYTDRGPQYQELFAERFAKTHGALETENVVLSTGVMYSIAAAIDLFTGPGDGVLIMRPCYRPFTVTTERLGRMPVFVDMPDTPHGFELDIPSLDEAAARCRALILCNPHNPTGRVFSERELKAIADICERHGLTIIADEIHCDFVYPPHRFASIATVSPYAREQSICCVAPTKSFNLAGIKVSAALIRNPVMLERFRVRAQVTGINSINLFAMEAVKAAYRRSANWQRALLSYLEGNRELVASFIEESGVRVRAHKPEGTYFFWLEFPGRQDVTKRLRDEAGVILSDGVEFAPGCSERSRLNFACPRPVLSEALARIRCWEVAAGNTAC